MYYDGELINKAIENLKNADSYLKNADNYTGKILVDDCQAISDSWNSKNNRISDSAINGEDLGTFSENVTSLFTNNDSNEANDKSYKFDDKLESSNNQEDLNKVYIEYLKNEYNLTEEQAEEKFKEIERLIVSNKIEEIKKELNIELDSDLTNEELDKIINGDINLEDFFIEKSSSYRIKCQQLIISNQLILALNESEEFKEFNLTSYEDIEKAITKQQQTISDLENKRDNIQVPYDAKLFNKLLNKYPNPDLNNLLVYQNEETKEYWFAYYYDMGKYDIGSSELYFIGESECLGNASELGIDINTIKENINQIKEIDTEIKKEREILSILKDTKETIDYQVTYYEKYMDPYIYNPDFVSKSAIEWREEGIISEICNITNYIYDYSKNCYLNQEFMDKYSDSLEYHEDPIHSYVKISNLENHPEIRDSLVLALINGSNIVFQEDGTFFDEDNGIYLYVDDTTYFESLGTIISGMDETHKAIFNYIHNTKGSEAAFEYINNNDVMNHINSEYLNLEKQKWEKYTIAEEGESQFLKSLRASLASIVIRPFEGLNSAIYSIRANSYDEKTYSGAMFMGSSYMRQLVGSTIDSDFWKFVYDTGMSMGDSTLLMLATMATGGGTSCLWSALIMGTPGYTEKYNEMIERGFTQEQAMEAGLVSAFIESLTEAYSTGHLLNLEGNLGKITANGLAKIESALGNSKYSTFAKGLYIAIAGMNNQAIANGEEEVCSEILNFIYDLEACGEGSVLNTRVAELMENDSLMTEDQAVFIALKEECSNIALSFAGGYLSGLFMGAIPSIKTAIQYNSTNSISGIQVMHETNPELAEVKLQEFNKFAQQLGLPSLSFDGEGNIAIYEIKVDDISKPLLEIFEKNKLIDNGYINLDVYSATLAFFKKNGFDQATLHNYYESIFADVENEMKKSMDIENDISGLSPSEQDEYYERALALGDNKKIYEAKLNKSLSEATKVLDIIYNLGTVEGYFDPNKVLEAKIKKNSEAKKIEINGVDYTKYFPYFDDFYTEKGVLAITCKQTGLQASSLEDLAIQLKTRSDSGNPVTVTGRIFQNAASGANNFVKFGGNIGRNGAVEQCGAFFLTESPKNIAKRFSDCCHYDSKTNDIIVDDYEKFGEKVLGGVPLSGKDGIFQIQVVVPVNNVTLSCPSVNNLSAYIAYFAPGATTSGGMSEMVMKGSSLPAENNIIKKVSTNDNIYVGGEDKHFFELGNGIKLTIRHMK